MVESRSRKSKGGSNGSAANHDAPEAARQLLGHGFALCKPSPGTKNPVSKGWSTRSLKATDFRPGDLVGILGGPLSDGNRAGHALVVVDLDAAAAVERAGDYLPQTGMVDGRPGKPRSHHYYLVPVSTIPTWAVSEAEQAAPAALKAKGHAGPFLKHFHHADTEDCVLDFIGTGGQAVAPPSQWCGADARTERRLWYGADACQPGDPAVVPFPLLWGAACELAIACGCERPAPPTGAPRTFPAGRTARDCDANLIKRARAWLATKDISVSHKQGHNKLFSAARDMVYGFGLGVELGFQLLQDDFNPRCQPPWSDAELRHKCQDALDVAYGKPFGHLRDEERPRRNGRDQSHHANGKPRATTPAVDATTTPAVDATTTPAEPRGKPANAPEPYRPFPVSALPTPIATFAYRGAEALKCDPVFFALPALAVAAGLVGNARTVRLKEGAFRWDEPCVLWSLLVADSGALKTPAFRFATRHVFRLQEQMLERHKVKLEAHERDKADYDRRRRAFVNGKGKGDNPGAPPKCPPCERIVCSNTTVETLAMMLTDNPRGLLLARDELAGWFKSFDQYKTRGGDDLQNWLEMHGAGTVMVDRKTGDRKTLFVPHAAVSITGGIQHGTLARAMTPEFMEAGLGARMLMAMPPRQKKQWSEVEVDQLVDREYRDALDRLLRLDLDVTGDGVKEVRKPVALPLDDDARRLWASFYDEWAGVQESAEGNLASVYAKLEGGAARLALLHHLVNDAGGGRLPVGVNSLAAGIELARWFAAEGERVYAALAETPEQRATRTLVELVRALGGSCTAQQLQNRRGKTYPTADLARNALDSLVSQRVGEWVRKPPGPKGGRPVNVLVLSPGAHDQEDPEREPGVEPGDTTAEGDTTETAA